VFLKFLGKVVGVLDWVLCLILGRVDSIFQFGPGYKFVCLVLFENFV